MNLDKLTLWVSGVVLAFAIMGKLDVLQAWIWRAQAKAVYESRTSTWGSPRMFLQNEVPLTDEKTPNLPRLPRRMRYAFEIARLSGQCVRAV